MIDRQLLLSRFILGVLLITAFFILLFLYSKFLGPLPVFINSIVTNKSDIFSSTGEGTAFIKPDIAVVRAGVQSNGQTVKEAQDQLNANINKVTESVKALGIKTEDIETENYNIYPNTDFREGQNQKITGYSANTNLAIRVKEIDKTNQIIDAVTRSGANMVSGVTFEVSDKTKAVNEAREEAVKEAKQNAENAAKVAGFTLGKLINYNEWMPQDGPIGLAKGAAEVSTQEDQAPTTNVQPGTTQVKINVTLSYEIR